MAVKAVLRHILAILSISMIVIAATTAPVRGQEAVSVDDAAAIDSGASASVVEAVDLPGRVDDDVNLRSAPEVTDETYLRTLQLNDGLWVYDSVTDDEGNVWDRVGDDEYVQADEMRLPKPPPETFPGRWIDVDLSSPAMLTAYEDDQPVFSALAIKGRTATETPEGTYQILRRVADETMDSSTIGIPRSSPGGYYLQHVLYTQYFTNDGASIHDNYWSNVFGDEGSHGCVGLSEDDAAWVWDWADVGTVVNIHS